MQKVAMGCGWLGMVGVSLFVGLMIATAGGAVYPPIVARPAALICDGEVELKTSNYSYEPGRRVTSHVFTCVSADGERKTILWQALGVSMLIYSGIVFVLLHLGAFIGWGLFKSTKRRHEEQRLSPRPPAAGSARTPQAEPPRVQRPDQAQTQPRPPAAPLDDAIRGSIVDALRQVGLVREGDGSQVNYSTEAQVFVNGMRIQDAERERALHPAPGDASSLEDRLKLLEVLRSRGVISEDEHRKRRDELLNSI